MKHLLYYESYPSLKIYNIISFKMNIKTSLFEGYVSFVDNTKRQYKKLWVFTIILVFIMFILTIIRVFKYINE